MTGPPCGGTVGSGPQVVVLRLGIELLSTVAEEVGVGVIGVALYAKGVVGIVLDHRARAVGELHHVPMGIVVVVDRLAVLHRGNQVQAPDVGDIRLCRIGVQIIQNDPCPHRAANSRITCVIVCVKIHRPH